MIELHEVRIAIPDDVADAIDRAIQAGEYASKTDVMREALREWGLRRMHREELGRLWDAGLASGEAVDGAEAFDRIQQRLQRGLKP